MAVDESDFKSGFRKDLQGVHTRALIWTNNDMFRAGLPDFSVLHDGSFYAIEAKFVSALPKRATSLCLKHEVTLNQIDYINKVRDNGQYGCVLVGLADVAVVMLDIKKNYTLQELLSAPRIERAKGRWVVDKFLDLIRGVRG